MLGLERETYKKRPSNVLPMEAKLVRKTTIKESLKNFVKDMQAENLGQRTIAFHMENMAAMLKILEKQGIIIKIPAKLTKDMIKQNLILYMVSKNYKPNTINGRIKTLRKYITFLSQEDYIETNFASTLKKVRGKGEPIQAFTKDQVARLLEQPDRTTFTGFRDYTIFLLLLDTGIRLAELCGLRIQDVDLKEGMIKVSGKGSSGHVPFSGRCAKILEKYLYYRDLRPNDSDHLFTSIHGTALSRSTIQDQFKKYGKKAKIVDVRVSPHTMRHTFAKYYILGGGDAFSLQKILRHKNMDTVKIYVNLWGGEVKKQHDKYSP
ncbi:MAG: integrase [Firmicutes bacterium]|nr:integrase [Bacillota bacterium]